MSFSRRLLALGLLLCGTALGNTLPLRSLLTSSPFTTVQLGYTGNVFLVSQYAGDGRDLLLGVGQQSTSVPGRVNRVYVVVQREYLSPAECSRFNSAMTDVALKCFNPSIYVPSARPPSWPG